MHVKPEWNEVTFTNPIYTSGPVQSASFKNTRRAYGDITDGLVLSEREQCVNNWSAAHHARAPPTLQDLGIKEKHAPWVLAVPSSSYSANTVFLSLPSPCRLTPPLFFPCEWRKQGSDRQKKREAKESWGSNFGTGTPTPITLCLFWPYENISKEEKEGGRRKVDGGECREGALTQ